MLPSYRAFAKYSESEVLRKLTTTKTGLTSAEVSSRLKLFGKNLVAERGERLHELILRQLRSPFIYILALAALISFALGEIIDSLLIVSFVVINTLLGFIQEYRSHRAVELLRHYLIHECLAIRDGRAKTINATELLPGDLVLLRAGDKIPADVRFIEANNLRVDESILTGESISVDKQAESLTSNVDDYYQAKNIGFSGTLVVSGTGKAVVLATGKNTQLGALSERVIMTQTASAFEVGVSRLSQFILKLSLATIAIVFLLNLMIKGVAFQAGQFVVFALALLVGVIPEALPLVTTVALSLSAVRLAKKKLVPKRLSAIEDLGSIDILATDKTGTITENRLSVVEVLAQDEAEILGLAILASSFFSHFSVKNKDAFEVAIWEELTQAEREKIGQITRLQEYPFDPVRKRAGALIRTPEELLVVTLGAPEEMVAGDSSKEKWISKQGEEGRRVLAVGKKVVASEQYDERDIPCVGLLSFSDPLKKGAKHALAEAKDLGIQIKVLTGDGVEVATSISLEAGLIDSKEQVLSGKEWRLLSEDEKRLAVHKYSVFARLTPVDKYEIIRTLKDLDHTVGFLGEGFNDAPALKLSHVGLAVPSAADISREAADIILLSRSLEVIVDGVREGRRTFANTFKYIKATLTSNFGNFYALAIASLFVPFHPMLPAQILLVNLLSDFPLISIADDAVERGELLSPRSYAIREIAFFATILGLISTVFDFAFFAYFLQFGQEVLQTAWFIGSILTELVIFYSIRTRGWFFRAVRPSLIIVVLTIFTSLATAAIPGTNFGRDFFGFTTLTTNSFMVISLLVVAYFTTSEVAKIIYYLHFRKGGLSKFAESRN